MAVEEQQTGASLTPSRQNTTQQDGAVAAEDDREVAALPNRRDRVGERERIGGDLARIQQSGNLVALWIVRWRLDTPGVACADPLRKPCSKQRIG